MQINQGLAIGNGLTNPEIQYKSYRDYALNMKLISRVEYYRLIVAQRFCETNIRACGNKNHHSSLNITIKFQSFFCLNRKPVSYFTAGANSTSLVCAEAYVICTGLFRRIIASKPGINVPCFLELIQQQKKTPFFNSYTYI